MTGAGGARCTGDRCRGDGGATGAEAGEARGDCWGGNLGGLIFLGDGSIGKGDIAIIGGDWIGGEEGECLGGGVSWIDSSGEIISGDGDWVIGVSFFSLFSFFFWNQNHYSCDTVKVKSVSSVRTINTTFKCYYYLWIVLD